MANELEIKYEDEAVNSWKDETIQVRKTKVASYGQEGTTKTSKLELEDEDEKEDSDDGKQTVQKLTP